ncbi:MAG TPA: hypothetical protein VNH11_12075 [Pirellulales bacterium]|nr:hypothetical protein [Pirellulales bacterium]
MPRSSRYPTFASVWKEALVAYLHPFMGFFFPDVQRDIAPARGYERLDGELQEITAESGPARRVADTLVRVWRTNGDEVWLLIHFEVDGPQETDFTSQMFADAGRLFGRYRQKVAGFAVLGDERPFWRPDRFAYEPWGTKFEAQLRTAHLVDYPAELSALAADLNPLAVVVCAYRQALRTVDDDEARRRAKLRLVKGLHAREMWEGEIRQLYCLIDGMMGLPQPQADLAWQELCDFERENGRQYISDAEGVFRVAGWAEVRDNYLRQVEAVLRFKFREPGLALVPEVRRIEDVDLLRKVLATSNWGSA